MEVNSMTICRITDECIACDACVDECPQNCISEGEPYVVETEKCDGCGNCVDVCPVDCCIIE